MNEIGKLGDKDGSTAISSAELCLSMSGSSVTANKSLVPTIFEQVKRVRGSDTIHARQYYIINQYTI